MAKIPKRRPGKPKLPPWPQCLDPMWHQTDIFEQIKDAEKRPRRKAKAATDGE